MSRQWLETILADLADRHGGTPQPEDDRIPPLRPGGNTTLHLQAYPGPERVFVKTASPTGQTMLEGEFDGLVAIRATGTVRVPQPLGCGVNETHAWLLTEFLDLRPPTPASDTVLGEQLARLHEHSASRHGWHRDNTIGTNPQPNARDEDWGRFFARQRIGFQLQLAADNGYTGKLQKLGERLMLQIPHLLSDHQPQPSLLHGDLWSGNRAALADGTPVIYDPAAHYGDGECDLAMSELFGAFDPGFYARYQEYRPLPAGYPLRRDLYQLYHVLNHMNLFGSGWARQAEQLMRKLLAQTQA